MHSDYLNTCSIFTCLSRVWLVSTSVLGQRIRNFLKKRALTTKFISPEDAGCGSWMCFRWSSAGREKWWNFGDVMYHDFTSKHGGCLGT